MERFYKKVLKPVLGSHEEAPNRKRTRLDSEPKFVVPSDPGLRPLMSSYHPNDRDMIRREYLQQGPRQPIHDFPQTRFSDKLRRFNRAWYNDYPSWLEYSIQKDAAYCLFCYLFKPENQEGGGDAFTVMGFRNWKSPKLLDEHVGGLNSAHNLAQRKCQDLMKQEQSISTIFEGKNKRSVDEYRLRLNASVDCIRFLLRQGLPFRGNDESEYSKNRGNFLELLRFLANQNADIGAVLLQNAPSNHKLVAPDIQKDIVHAAAVETTKKIIEELGDELFSVLVDESRDVSCKEQMAIIVRFVNKQGSIVERFLGIVHVPDTTAISLKASLEEFFCMHGLSFSRLRGQGYDGASNMRGEFNGLKALILKENSSAHYVHCFAHQLQLVLVAVAKKHLRVAELFNWILIAQNTVGASCKRRDNLREKRAAMVKDALEKGDLSTGRGLNQETSLARPGVTRWSSHYNSLVSLVVMFGPAIEVLRDIVDYADEPNHRANASILVQALTTFDFIFGCLFMRKVLGITHELSQALQRKEQDIMNAVSLVAVAKSRLQDLRENGWDSLLDEVNSFCSKHKIDVLNMEDMWVAKRSQRGVQAMTNRHSYCVEFFYAVIDMILQELESRFTEGSTELLRCMSCLHPSNNFQAFDKVKLMELASFYPNDFSDRELSVLESQLECYVRDVQSDDDFSELNGMSALSEKLVAKRKNLLYPLVYKLIKLALILPVATASVERAFSAMNIIKNHLRNRIGDEWMNDNLVTYIEKDVFRCVTNEAIMQRFQNMKTRRGLLLLLE